MEFGSRVLAWLGGALVVTGRKDRIKMHSDQEVNVHSGQHVIVSSVKRSRCARITMCSDQDALGSRCTRIKMHSDQEIKMYSDQDMLGIKMCQEINMCSGIKMYARINMCSDQDINMYLDQDVLGSRDQDVFDS